MEERKTSKVRRRRRANKTPVNSKNKSKRSRNEILATCEEETEEDDGEEE